MLEQLARRPAGDADSPVECIEEPSRGAPIEVAAKLRWSARKATTELRYADQLVHRLPNVHAAFVVRAVAAGVSRRLDALAAALTRNAAGCQGNGQA